jgi:hypothetical protein
MRREHPSQQGYEPFSFQDTEPVSPSSVKSQGSGGEQCPELLFDKPRGLQLPGGIIGSEHGTEPVPCPVRERVSATQQQPTVGPDWIDGAPPPAMNGLFVVGGELSSCR